MARKRLGEVLCEHQSISAETLEQAIRDQQGKTLFLGELLLQRALVDKPALVQALEEVTGLKYLDARHAAPSPEALELIPRASAERYNLLPLSRNGTRVTVIMAEPQNLRLVDELRFLCGGEIAPCLGFRQEILEAIERCYPSAEPEAPSASLPSLTAVGPADVEFFSAGAGPRGQAAIAQFQEELRRDHTPAVEVVSTILFHAAQRGASDVHIEQHAESALVRLRVDGILRELTHIPAGLRIPVISRIKILADMDIAERRSPQDGRFLMRIGDVRLDLRVSTLPTQYGEKVVIRLLNPTAASANFHELGFSQQNSMALAHVLAQPQGMLLVTGPTGSGKSTTLYAALSLLRSPGVNIVTVEDPIEYVLEGVNQVQVNPRAGRTFAACLRSMLRQDPNVIMVGEIRDQETAEIALQASQTGHLVLSTLHTNDSVAAITRLLDLGVPAFLVASSVSAVMAQRLVRKLCSCSAEVPATPEYAAHMTAARLPAAHMHVPRGCEVCGRTGYKGRVGIYELLPIDEELRAAIRNGKKDDEIRTLARASGMKLMQEDALRKVRVGVTALEEVMRVVPFEENAALHCPACNEGLAPTFAFCPYCGHRLEQGGPVVRLRRPRIRAHGGAA
jgi:type IV pilus assembly protein PilB